MTSLEFFQNNFSNDDFEKNSNENGFTFWYASYLMDLLDYSSMQSFMKAINKAMTTSTTLNIPIHENFITVNRELDGKTFTDFKLSRFACYLTVMNADNKKRPVAEAQAYFATLAGAMQNYLEESEKVDRVIVKGEITEKEQSLTGVAKKAGIESYPLFQNAGYRGMYNMNIGKLKEFRGIPSKRTVLDFMGKEELAAHYFRITQTELKVKQNPNISGQKMLEYTAETVGKQVRNTMIEISNTAPELLPMQQDIKEVKKQLKAKSKSLKKIDKK
ncbi:MAG: damage-inducible protein D [Bacteroidetes bacterium]|nr:damage-inducible protein D [Bacteroidota bacterium]